MVSIAVDTKLVREEEICIAQLSLVRFLIYLPRGLAVDTFVSKTPNSLWDEGFTFQHWSQTEGAAIVVPRFKVSADLEEVPMHLWDEPEIIKAVSKFGLYLGTVAPEHETDFMAWRVAFSTDDLQTCP